MKITEITKKKWRDLQMIYGPDINYKCSIAQPHRKKLFMFVL